MLEPHTVPTLRAGLQMTLYPPTIVITAVCSIVITAVCSSIVITAVCSMVITAVWFIVLLATQGHGQHPAFPVCSTIAVVVTKPVTMHSQDS